MVADVRGYRVAVCEGGDPAVSGLRTLAGPVTRRVLWGLTDQAVSAATNVGLTIIVARTSSVPRLGQFSLVFIVFIVVVGVTRSTGTGVLAIEYADDPERLRSEAARSTGYAIGVGAVIGLLLALAGFGLALTGRHVFGATMVVLGLSLPWLLLQDSWRGVFFTQGRPQRALVIDLVWALVMIVLLVRFAHSTATPPIWLLMSCWALGGIVAAVAGSWLAGVLPRPAWPTTWLRRHWPTAGPLVASELLTQLPAQVTYLALPFVASVSELGIVRAAYIFFGPLAVLNAGAAMLALPQAVRLRESGLVQQLTGRVSMALAGVACLWGLVVCLLPDVIGQQVIGQAWPSSGPSRLLLAISLVAEGVLIGQVAALGALRRTRTLMHVRLAAAPVIVVTSLVLASRYGAGGAAGGFAIGYSLAAAMAWYRVRDCASPQAVSVPAVVQQPWPIGSAGRPLTERRKPQ